MNQLLTKPTRLLELVLELGRSALGAAPGGKLVPAGGGRGAGLRVGSERRQFQLESRVEGSSIVTLECGRAGRLTWTGPERRRNGSCAQEKALPKGHTSFGGVGMMDVCMDGVGRNACSATLRVSLSNERGSTHPATQTSVRTPPARTHAPGRRRRGRRRRTG